MTRLGIGAGWSLLVWFAWRAALMGGVAADPRAFETAYVVGFAGYLLLCWIVSRAGAGVPLGRWRWWLVGCIALRAATIATVPGDDAYRYVWEGRVQLAGANPYALAPDAPELRSLRDRQWASINHRDYTAIYAPIAEMQFALAAWLSPSVQTIKALHVLWDVLVVVVVGSCLRRAGRRPHAAIVYGLCPLVLTAFGIEGHVDSLMLLAIAATVWALQTNKPYMAGAMLGIAIGAKPVAVVLLPWFIVRHRRAAAVAAGVVIVSYVPYAAAGTGVFASLVRFNRANTFFNMVATLGGPGFDTPMLHMTVGAVLLLVVFVCAWHRAAFTHFAVGAIGATLAAMPVMHYWYIASVLLFVVFHRRVSWIVAALAMVFYFEGERWRAVAGVWMMPTWVPTVVWRLFVTTWLVEAAAGRRRGCRLARMTPSIVCGGRTRYL